MPTTTLDHRRHRTFVRSFASCNGKALMNRIWHDSFPVHPAVEWLTCQRESHGTISLEPSMPSTSRAPLGCATEQCCCCSRRPDCAIKNCGCSSYTTSTGDPVKC